MKLLLAVLVCALAGCGHKASPPPSNVAEPTSAPDAALADPPTEPSADGQCPAGQRYDECASSSCDGCEDCVGACVPL